MRLPNSANNPVNCNTARSLLELAARPQGISASGAVDFFYTNTKQRHKKTVTMHRHLRRLVRYALIQKYTAPEKAPETHAYVVTPSGRKALYGKGKL